MSPSDDYASIADSSKPNAGRIYDFLLGGNHNFEVDRQSAEQIKQFAPFTPEMVRLIRWFLGEAVRRLMEQGYTRFLDFASGLPTQDHIHEIAPDGSKVIYSDIDPITVEYGTEILKNNPNAVYVHCDCRQPEALLNSDIVQEMFGDERKVAIGFNGITWFIPDEAIDHAMKVLYDWADEGSMLFISDFDQATMTDDLKSIMELYAKMGSPYYLHSIDELEELVAPWKIVEPGLLDLEQWLGMGDTVKETQESAFGGALYGALLKK